MSDLRQRLAEAEEAAGLAIADMRRAESVSLQLSARVESLILGIECLVADEVISSGRARELHGLSVEEQREFRRRHPNDLYKAGPDAPDPDPLQRCSNALCRNLAYLDGDYCSERCRDEGERPEGGER